MSSSANMLPTFFSSKSLDSLISVRIHESRLGWPSVKIDGTRAISRHRWPRQFVAFPGGEKCQKMFPICQSSSSEFAKRLAKNFNSLTLIYRPMIRAYKLSGQSIDVSAETAPRRYLPISWSMATEKLVIFAFLHVSDKKIHSKIEEKAKRPSSFFQLLIRGRRRRSSETKQIPREKHPWAKQDMCVPYSAVYGGMQIFRHKIFPLVSRKQTRR